MPCKAEHLHSHVPLLRRSSAKSIQTLFLSRKKQLQSRYREIKYVLWRQHTVQYGYLWISLLFPCLFADRCDRKVHGNCVLFTYLWESLLHFSMSKNFMIKFMYKHKLILGIIKILHVSHHVPISQWISSRTNDSFPLFVVLQTAGTQTLSSLSSLFNGHYLINQGTAGERESTVRRRRAHKV